MSEQRENASAAFPTRRSLREAERKAARARSAAAQERDAGRAISATQTSDAEASGPSVSTETDATPTTAADSTPSTATGATPATAPTDVTANSASTAAGPASALQAAHRGATVGGGSAPKIGGFARRWLPRVAVLGSLAIATTAIPLSGAATGEADASPSATFAASSALDVLVAEQVDGTDVFDGATSFQADPLAEARALLGAARTEDREVLTCGSSELEANGQVAAGATTEPVEVMMPLQQGVYRITSRYGYRWGGKHEGLDMAAPAGTLIHSVAAGEVTYVGYGLGGRSGMIIVIKHEVNGETFWTWYIHMYPNGIFVSVGDTVGAGDVIGEVGSYGNSTGPHLHLEVHVDDEYTTVDPAVWLATHNAAPLTDENLACAAR